MHHVSWSVLEHVTDAIVVLDDIGTPLRVNAAARRLYDGGDPHTPGGAGLAEILGLDAAGVAVVEEAVRAALGGSPAAVELECITGSGKRLALTIVRSDEEAAAGVVVIARAPSDATSSGQQLQRLADATAEAVCVHDGRVVVFANEAMLRAFGRAPAELTGLRVGDLFQARPGEDLSGHLGVRGEHTFEATARRKDGGSFVAEVVSKPVGVPAHALYGLTIRDVTAHRATAQAFHDSEERFRLISELSSEGLVLTEGGVIFHANEAMTTLFGYRREELIGMSAIELTAREDREVAIAHIRSGSEEPYEAAGVRRDGSTFIGSISGASLPYQGRVVRGSRIRDVSAQRQADEARRQTIVQEEKLRIQAERLAEMSTPLISITREILAMPLVGTMDMARARQALKTMLDGIAQSDAHTAIVDVTGISGVDTSVVASLVRLAQAVRLQGAQVVLTGIRAQVADTLVTLDVNLAGIVIKGSFQDGIRYAMKRGKQGWAAPDLG